MEDEKRQRESQPVKGWLWELRFLCETVTETDFFFGPAEFTALEISLICVADRFAAFWTIFNICSALKI